MIHICTSILEQHNSCKIHLSEPEMVFASHVGRITPRIKSNRYLCNHHSAKWPPGVQSADNGCQTPPCPRFKSLAGSELRKISRIPKCCGHPSPQCWAETKLVGGTTSWILTSASPQIIALFRCTVSTILHKSKPKQIKMLQSTQNSGFIFSQSLLVVRTRPIWLDRSASWISLIGAEGHMGLMGLSGLRGV